MIDLKRRIWKSNLFLLALLGAISIARADCPGQACGGSYTLTKYLIGASGIANLPSGTYQLSFSFGEDAAGQLSSNASTANQVASGYFGASFGSGQTFKLLSLSIDGASLFQDGVRIGVPLNAGIHLTFADPIEPSTLSNGLQVQVINDHLGQSQQTLQPIQFSYAAGSSSVTITPVGNWSGNTLYSVSGNSSLQSVDGFTLADSTPTPFLTFLQPADDNVVSLPVGGNSPSAGAPGSSGFSGVTPLNIHIVPGSLPEEAAILVSHHPLVAPLQTSAAIIQTADAKAIAINGLYASPVQLEEIEAVNASGSVLSKLSQPAQLSLDFSANQGIVGGTGSLVRAGTLALWALDTDRQLWVKIPASRITGGVVTAPVSKLSVFALMGQAAGSASDVYVFPNPWRPHGSKAGTGIGQTGTDAAGMTFTNLPSECTIKILTISGELVRTLKHSDTGGQLGEETWDVHTTHGDTAASGVYLWRVESSADAKNGKLIVIR